MHIILDSNIYAADYRMKGAAFQSLFEYLRRTQSQLVLPRAIREEVVVGFGRRLDAGAKAFEAAWRKFQLLNLETSAPFQRPDCNREKRALRAILMNPADGVALLYVPDLTGNFVQEAFMRGVHRIRPSNDDGEELRDVILWLWTLSYCDGADAPVVFISDDGGFWDEDSVHPHIKRDMETKDKKLLVYRSIPDFLKDHAPRPVDATKEWIEKHFDMKAIERALIDAATERLNRSLSDSFSEMTIKAHEISAGKVYEVSDDSQFAELDLHVVFDFLRTATPTPRFYSTSPAYGNIPLHVPAIGSFFGQAYISQFDAPRYQPLSSLLGVQPTLTRQEPRRGECSAHARVTLRVKDGQTMESSVDQLSIDRKSVGG